MDITDKDLQAWSASDEFKLWFAHRFGDACDYQRLLERLAEEDMPEEANWLMKCVLLDAPIDFGPGR